MCRNSTKALAIGLVSAFCAVPSLAAAAETVLKAITYAPLAKVEDSMVIFKKWVDKVNAAGKLHFSYERYLINSIRHAASFAGSPIRLLVRRSAAKRKGTAGSQPSRGSGHRRS